MKYRQKFFRADSFASLKLGMDEYITGLDCRDVLSFSIHKTKGGGYRGYIRYRPSAEV